MFKHVFSGICLWMISLTVVAQTDSSLVLTVDTTVPVSKSVAAPFEGYKMKYGIDVPLTLAGVGWTLYGFNTIYKRDRVSEAEILALDPADVNSLDRPYTRRYNMKAKDLSDKFFYGSMPAPLLLLLDKKIRNDGHQVGLLYLEAMAVTGVVYTSASMLTSRFRPLAYNDNVDLATRTRGGSRNSFPAGHPALVATSTFFMAKVYTDYHPNMKGKGILFALAGAATITTGILRMEGGQHFPTDIMAGIPLGVLSGLMIPHFHKNKKNNRLSILPYYSNDATGATAILKL
jgi:membrane-associated phospholipid phosphatase